MSVNIVRRRPSKWPPILFVCFIAAAIGIFYKLLYDPTVKISSGTAPAEMVFAADGSALALSGRSDLELYAFPDYTRIARLNVSREHRPVIAWSADLSYVALSVRSGTSIEIRNVRSDSLFRSLPSNAPGEIILREDANGSMSTYGPEKVEQLAWSPDGRYLAIIRYSGAAQLWDLQTNATIMLGLNANSHDSCLAWSIDSQLLMFNDANVGRLAIYSAPDFAAPRQLEPNERCAEIALHPNGKLLALNPGWMGGSDAAIEVWDIGTMIRTATRPVRAAALAWHPTEEVLALANHNRLELWRPFDDEVVLLADLDETEITAIAFTPDGRDILLSTDDGRVRAWPLAERAPTLFQ